MDRRATTLHRRFEQQAEYRPRAIAVECAGVRLNFRELNSEANRLARRLVEEGVGEDEPVLVAVERSIDLLVGLFAVLKAGGAFVLTEDAPSALAARAREVGANVVLADSPLGFEGQGLRIVGCYEVTGTDQNLDPRSHGDGFACVISQNGWTHRWVLNRLDAAAVQHGLREGDTVVNALPLSGLGGVDLFLPLVTGARLVLASPEDLRDSSDLEELVAHSRCRVVQWMPPIASAAGAR